MELLLSFGVFLLWCNCVNC